jgi:periplasmic protein TonB
MVNAAFSSDIGFPEALVAPPLTKLSGPLAVPALARGEIGWVVVASVLVHASVAAAAFGAPRSNPAPRARSRVEIAVERPRLAQPVPPPAVVPRVEPKRSVAERRVLARPAQAPEPEPTLEAPPPSVVDTGSSAPAAENGELFRGSGGLGVAPPPLPVAPTVAPKPEPKPAVVPAHEGANYLKNPRPGYPSLARRQGWEGTTLLRVQVSQTGRPGLVQVQRSSGRSALDDAALEAVRRWSFVPATQGGAPVAGWVTVPIVFRLQ